MRCRARSCSRARHVRSGGLTGRLVPPPPPARAGAVRVRPGPGCRRAAGDGSAAAPTRQSCNALTRLPHRAVVGRNKTERVVRLVDRLKGDQLRGPRPAHAAAWRPVGIRRATLATVPPGRCPDGHRSSPPTPPAGGRWSRGACGRPLACRPGAPPPRSASRDRKELRDCAPLGSGRQERGIPACAGARPPVSRLPAPFAVRPTRVRRSQGGRTPPPSRSAPPRAPRSVPVRA